jgi:hypothetical protein
LAEASLHPVCASFKLGCVRYPADRYRRGDAECAITANAHIFSAEGFDFVEVDTIMLPQILDVKYIRLAPIRTRGIFGNRNGFAVISSAVTGPNA